MSFKLLKSIVVLTALAAAVGTFLLPGKASAAPGGNYNYIIHPAVDGVGTSHISFVIGAATPSPNSTAAYIPNQFFIVSPTPHFQFELRGGGFYPGTSGTVERFDKAGRQNGGNAYEIYQLSNAGPHDGRRLGILFGNDQLNAFPAIDNSEGRSSTCRHQATNAVVDCWAKFNDSNFKSPVDPAGRFNSSTYPYLNGYYVFLLKVIIDDRTLFPLVLQGKEQNNGYISGYQNISRANGCPVLTPGNVTFCGDDIRLPQVDWYTGYRNGYFVRTPSQYYLSSAPSNLAFNFVWGLAFDTGNPGDTYKDVFGTNYQGTHFTGAGRSCRADALPPPPGEYFAIENVDWDWLTTNIGARIYPPGSDVDQQYISDNWSSVLYQHPRMPVPANVSEGTQGTLEILRWKRFNNLYVGSAQFTWGSMPGCAGSINVNSESPLASGAGYGYDGRDAFTLNGVNQVDTRLLFRFNYRLNTTSSLPIGKADWTVYVDGQPRTSGSDLMVSGNTFNPPDQTPEINMNSIGEGSHTWQAYVSATGKSGWSAVTTFYVDKGPTTQSISSSAAGTQYPAATTNVNYNCDLLTASATDPEGQNVTPRFFISWTKPGTPGGRVQSSDGPTRASGSTYTSDEMNVNGKTVTRYLREDIPDGADVTWTLRAYDSYGASDGSFLQRFFAAQRGGPVVNADILQLQTGDRWGPQNPVTYHKNTRPDFDAPGGVGSTKNFFESSTGGKQINSVADGQTVRVETTIRNSGETPTPYIEVNDYLGSLRDFEAPDVNSLTIKKNNGAPRALTAAEKRVVGPARVIVQSKTDPAQDQVLGNNPTANELRLGSWKLSFGNNQQVGPILPAGLMNPGDTITISYFVRANRNQTLGLGSPEEPLGAANYARGVRPGDANSQIFVRFQEDFCNSTNRVSQFIDPGPENQILAPWVRTGRGSVHSNRGIAGYGDSGQYNATFTITANGSIAHFSSQSGAGSSFSQYQNPTVDSCPRVQAGGIDWRREMIKNIQQLKAGATTIIAGPSNYTLPGEMSGVYQTPAGTGLTISGGQMSGVATIIVNGDLLINGNFSYAPNTASLSSLGIIVLGNVVVGPGVTNIVGSYFVLDGPKGVAQLAPGTNCPDIDPSNTDTFAATGKVSTGSSGNPLVVNGLMVARDFNFERYCVDNDPNRSSFPCNTTGGADPAEDIYYDGRVVANTPPGFGTFRNTTAWYEIAP